MRRRTLLRGAAALLLTPAFIKRAFADASIVQSGTPGTVKADGPLRVPLERARQAGRPLLVIVVPAGENKRWNRQHLISRWLLARDEDDHLASLALADVVCAPVSALECEGHLPPTLLVRAQRAEVPAGSRPPDDALFVRVDPNGFVTSSAGPAGDDLRHVTREVTRLLPVSQLTPIDRRRLAERAEGLRHRKIPGSTWAYTIGCGSHRPSDAQPDDEQAIIGCGMGSVGSRAAARFLRFYVSAGRRGAPACASGRGTGAT
jgi:hypothetical protein